VHEKVVANNFRALPFEEIEEMEAPGNGAIHFLCQRDRLAIRDPEMRNSLNFLFRFHRFLSSQLLYPILLSTLLAIVLYAGRVFQSHTLAHRNLVWNLFLAWIPYICSFTAAALHSLSPRGWWLILAPGVLWLIFFPNAPYILTDFTHLEDHPRVPIWYDILLFASFAWTGCFLAIASLRTMQILVKRYLGWLISWLFAAFALVLGGLGIYLGRFSRWNSWDLFFRPEDIFLEIASRLVDPWSNLRFFGFIALFTAFLVVCYLMFISVRRVSD
jgi:uncharacterized membrane protein